MYVFIALFSCFFCLAYFCLHYFFPFNTKPHSRDTLTVWKKISVQKEHQRFKPELEEEFEDSAGNVVTRKTFEDLKRQGLL
jgi:hypothetical protein